MATLILLAGVGAMSLNIFLPSLPAMAQHFGVEYGLIQLAVSLYLATTALVQILIGPISDRYGRRPVVLAALGLFILVTIGAIFAPNFTVFMICRMLQASITTGLAMSRAIVRDMVPQDQAASMIGYVTMGMAVVPMISPAFGGWIEGFAGWQGSFWMLAGAGVIVLVICVFDLGETFTRRDGGFAAQVREYPALLSSQRFWGYNLAAATASGAFFAYLGGAPYVGTEVFGMTPAQLGLYLGAPAIGYMIGNGLSGRYSVRFGVNTMVLCGAAMTVVGMGLLLMCDLVGLRGPQVFFGFMVFIGLGNGILLPNANAGMLSVRPHLAGSASGLGGAVMIGGGGALSAIASLVLGPGSGALPLIVLMFMTTAASLLCALWVLRRSRAIAD